MLEGIFCRHTRLLKYAHPNLSIHHLLQSRHKGLVEPLVKAICLGVVGITHTMLDSCTLK